MSEESQPGVSSAGWLLWSRGRGRGSLSWQRGWSPWPRLAWRDIREAWRWMPLVLLAQRLRVALLPRGGPSEGSSNPGGGLWLSLWHQVSWSEHSEAHSDARGGTQTPSLWGQKGSRGCVCNAGVFIAFHPRPSSTRTHLSPMMLFRPLVLNMIFILWFPKIYL